MAAELIGTLELDIAEAHLDLRLTGLTAVLAHRRRVRIPRERIHRAFVLGRSFAAAASPRLPCPGWSTRRHRVGVFGLGDTAQLWATGARPVVLALYLRGEPYHRIVCEVADPVQQAAAVNRWLRYGATAPRPPAGPHRAPRAARAGLAAADDGGRPRSGAAVRPAHPAVR